MGSTADYRNDSSVLQNKKDYKGAKSEKVVLAPSKEL